MAVVPGWCSFEGAEAAVKAADTENSKPTTRRLKHEAQVYGEHTPPYPHLPVPHRTAPHQHSVTVGATIPTCLPVSIQPQSHMNG